MAVEVVLVDSEQALLLVLQQELNTPLPLGRAEAVLLRDLAHLLVQTLSFQQLLLPAAVVEVQVLTPQTAINLMAEMAALEAVGEATTPQDPMEPVERVTLQVCLRLKAVMAVMEMLNLHIRPPAAAAALVLLGLLQVLLVVVTAEMELHHLFLARL